MKPPVRILLLAVLAAGLAGCFNPFNPRVAPFGGIPTPPPDPNTPVGILRLYEWCWDKRDPQLYRELFTDDYQFVFARTDTAGNAYRDRALTREDELQIAENIFVRGSATEPPPASISLEWTAALLPIPDSRPGKDRRVHREIAAQTLLRIEDPDIEVTGITRFFVVRGDSAKLPDELIQRGFKQDSTRWYIERIQDETLEGTEPGRAGVAFSTRRAGALRSPTPAQTMLGHRFSFGALLALYDSRWQLASSRSTAGATGRLPGYGLPRSSQPREPQ